MTEKTKRTMKKVTLRTIRVLAEAAMVTAAACLGGAIFADKACDELMKEIKNIKKATLEDGEIIVSEF